MENNIHLDTDSQLIKKNYKVLGMTYTAYLIRLESYLKPIVSVQDVAVIQINLL